MTRNLKTSVCERCDIAQLVKGPSLQDLRNIIKPLKVSSLSLSNKQATLVDLNSEVDRID